MIDTEGTEIPYSDRDIEIFNLILWGDGKIAMNIPRFEVGGEIYNSLGNTLQVDIKDILWEYLHNAKQLDDGQGFIPLAKMLREFADAYEHAATSFNH